MPRLQGIGFFGMLLNSPCVKSLSNLIGIGNHTFNHLKGWKTDDETYLANFLQADKLLHTNTFLIDKSRLAQALRIQKNDTSPWYTPDLYHGCEPARVRRMSKPFKDIRLHQSDSRSDG